MTAPRRSIIATQSMLIVCKAEFRDAMNVSLATIDSAGSPNVLSSPLVVALPVLTGLEPTVAYWTSWAMDDAQGVQMRQMFAQQGWRPLSGTEGTILGPTDAVPAFLTKQRWWVWDAVTTPSARALTSLGLAPSFMLDG